MKQLFLFMFAGVITLASCNSSDKPADVESIIKDSAKFTTIQWADTAINFGSKRMGEVVNITFICTNTGSKPLYLYEVHPSCGCTLVDYSKEPIAPGGRGKIDAQFDTKKSHPGEVFKKVYVHSNTSNYSPAALKFSGIVLDSTAASSSKQKS